MNYDRIILELLDRVKSLEEQVEDIKSALVDEDANEVGDGTNDTLTRFYARERVMKEIADRFPDYTVSKASRAEGNGIRLQTLNRIEPYRIKFYHSKLHERGHAWHSINLDEIVDISYVILSMVDADNQFQVFVFTSEELLRYEDNNRKGSENILHLYFTVNGNKATEIRETHIDVSEHLNNWDVLSPDKLIK